MPSMWLLLFLPALAQDWGAHPKLDPNDGRAKRWRYTLSPRGEDGQALWEGLSLQYRDLLRAGYRVELGEGGAALLPRGEAPPGEVLPGGEPTLLHFRSPARGQSPTEPLPDVTHCSPGPGPGGGNLHRGHDHPKPAFPTGAEPGPAPPNGSLGL
jgi:hypothetical protein